MGRLAPPIFRERRPRTSVASERSAELTACEHGYCPRSGFMLERFECIDRPVSHAVDLDSACPLRFDSKRGTMTTTRRFSQAPPDEANEHFEKLLATSNNAVEVRERLLADLQKGTWLRC
jgi:hypothetical protein